ncbi:MAG: lipase [Bacteroidaceae bacterium]|nr:lipase [Bacteroidaceae bacterium]
MKQFFSIILLAMLSLFTTQCAHSQVKTSGKSTNTDLFHPTDTNIQYIGRIEDSDPNFIKFTYPGVQIRTGFTGTRLEMMCKLRSGYFMAEIDGGEPFKISFLGNTVVNLARNLKDGTHQAIVTYIGEGYENVPEFHGFFVDKGKTLAPAAPLPSRKIEFIGNSITCGYGIEANSEADHYEDETANFYYTYAARTARNLDAQAVVVARSGIGVYRSYNGPKTGDKVNMNTEYPYTLLYNNKYEWDFSRYTPDLVCINLGTNDTSTQGADSTLLVNGFKQLYRQVRSHYPNAKIVLLCGCMMSGDQLRSAQQALDTTVAYAHQQGDKEVYRFDFTPHDGSLGYGADWHPSMRQHEKMANELTPYLKKLMNW